MADQPFSDRRRACCLDMRPKARRGILWVAWPRDSRPCQEHQARRTPACKGFRCLSVRSSAPKLGQDFDQPSHRSRNQRRSTRESHQVESPPARHQSRRDSAPARWCRNSRRVEARTLGTNVIVVDGLRRYPPGSRMKRRSTSQCACRPHAMAVRLAIGRRGNIHAFQHARQWFQPASRTTAISAAP